MNILYLITGLGVGGAEKQTMLLADTMMEKGHNVILVSLTGDTLVKTKSKMKVIELRMKKNGIGFLFALIKLRHIVKQFSPDVIHSHMFHANIFARLLRLTIKLPHLVCTAHSINEGGKARMLAYQLTDKLASISTNVCDEAVNAFIEKKASFPKKMIMVPNGIDTDKFKYSSTVGQAKRDELNIEKNTNVLLAIGRLTEAKDYPNLLNAFAYFLKSSSINKKSLLYIVGSGELDYELKKMAQELSITEYVIFLGGRDDIVELMSMADVFILSSEWEGVPLVIAEAMACERFIIATDVGGVKKLVGNCGYIVPSNNYMELSNSIISALDLGFDNRRKIGKLARNRIVLNNSIHQVADRWIDIYDNTNHQKVEGI